MPTQITLPVNFESPVADPIKLYAYAFSRGGKLLDRQEVTAHKATFNDFGLPGSEVRFFIVPAGDPSVEKVRTIDDVLKFQPFEPSVNWEKNKLITAAIPIKFPTLWKWVICNVKGTVIKNFNIHRVSGDKPICRARVHICDIDRILFWLNKIPDNIILRIPDIILKPEIPIRIPKPFPDPSPLSTNVISSRLATLTNANLFNSLTNLQITASALKAQVPVNEGIKRTLLSGNANLIRASVAQNLAIFHPYFCYYPFIWPWLYRLDELKTVYTDMNGRFDTNIAYIAGGDVPDLYFWVECQINGVWTTVYKPNIPCNTWWDYKCGTEVTIRLTDERVRWECQDVLPGELVWIKTIGDGASVSRIKQESFMQPIPNNTAPQPTPSMDRFGMSDASVGNGSTAVDDYKRPFGGGLSFRVQFSSGLRATGAVYYKWKWCKTHMPDLTPVNATPADSDFVDFSGGVSKQYSYEYLDIFNFKHIAYDNVSLGAQTVSTTDNCYIVPPVSPAMPPFNITRTSPQWNQDTDTISFDSNSLAGDGMYEFRMELYDAAGNRLTVHRSKFQVPEMNTFSPSVFAPTKMLADYNLLTQMTTAFKMKVRIDNQPVEAAVYKLNLNGVPASPSCCGFVNYGNNTANIEIGFKAYHPHGLGEFGFSIQKGTCDDDGVPAITNASGFVNNRANFYACDINGRYTKTFHPNALLGSCAAEQKAAFAEFLHVYALAINGTSRLDYLDKSASAAFALEP
ncbi:MAG: hypothetical protein ABIX01_09055 [Chitinophagaceae bacterium]